MKTRQQHNNAPRPRFNAMRKAATTLVGSLAAVAALTLAACSDDDLTAGTTPAITPVSLEFNMPEELQRLIYTDKTGSECLPLIKGETVQIPYTLEPDTVTFADVEWTSNNEAVATVDQEGNITAVSGDGTGNATVSVTPVGYLSSSGISASIKVVVSNELVEAETITINATADELYGGDTLHLETVIAPDNSTYKTVEWSSSDESLATVSADGILTAQVSDATIAPVTITATAIDGSGVTGSKTINIRQIVQPEEVTIDAEYNNSVWAFNEKTLKLDYTTVPAECTTSLIQWTSSDPAIATVDNGVVTFTGRGDVTITATCPETGQSSSTKLSIPSGFVRETYHNENNLTFSGDSYTWHDGYLTVKAPLSGTKCRGDLKNRQSVYLHAGNYPIIAVRMEDVKDKYAAEGVTKRNITLDGSSTGGFSGGLPSSNNKWLHDYKCSDGSHVFIYDLSQQGWQNGGLMPTNEEVMFKTFQFKYADIESISHDCEYNVYWLQTFKTMQDVADYINGEGLTYDIIK